MKPFFRRPNRAAALLALCLLPLATALPGCRSSSTPSQPDPGQTDARFREARELLDQAEAARKAGKNAQAADLYRRSLGLDGNSSAAWNNLGTLLIEQGDYMGAASALRSAATLAPPDDPRPLENLGLAYFRAGYDDEALRHYMESLQRDPNYSKSIRGVATCSSRLNSASDEILAVLNRGMMTERDPQWRQTITREKIRVEQQLKTEKEAARREGR